MSEPMMDAALEERTCAACGEQFTSPSLLRTRCRRCFERDRREPSNMGEFTRGYDLGWRNGSRFAADEIARGRRGALIAELIADQTERWEVTVGELRARIQDAEELRDLAREALGPLRAQVAALQDELRGERMARERERDEMREKAREEVRAEGALSLMELRDTVALCHPDRHPPERSLLANRITARLNSLIQARRRSEP